ncbi:hypothetical protein D9758_015369 [Tetrapyrgos nigripes]|uniref:Uncharacterized protein n=1 Tax=Tetrapyrgos nigripes TaxID=182062 RepID=A0A8H5FIK8_9AGAR|nr:hypothetical protein D9758_015369 [Tetrapyrgos nigripes]
MHVQWIIPSIAIRLDSTFVVPIPNLNPNASAEEREWVTNHYAKIGLVILNSLVLASGLLSLGCGLLFLFGKRIRSRCQKAIGGITSLRRQSNPTLPRSMPRTFASAPFAYDLSIEDGKHTVMVGEIKVDDDHNDSQSDSGDRAESPIRFSSMPVCKKTPSPVALLPTAMNHTVNEVEITEAGGCSEPPRRALVTAGKQRFSGHWNVPVQDAIDKLREL